ncbi:MAG: aldehyde dehydrogenase family protein [Levilactobacillus sp.]|jgi:succinate-semialdehyde dehydrogenase/glutarate-semialdehyde dehydrogenase|uniref:aldehyde dehydrogenase family protein n=1 Tax=Levilactobacillus sp. TaxID=2767919 RepID=UPI002590F86B|nr:aldehyde dehydrogenase family protein [Levilactobacillus sp.]MCH4123691.1 aldehyde dehydrogenase family protein [Levilactobacillus sp.]MCI1553789.1 aldehyde dehydrogenase family protein [Levilactobacillus sp.]MCI1599129.1 aldehyde dehydrogenase family protein [Levilactobacillus sp.]MCI1605371.1 aldehyde dehydrogenase family protein [Levilactobacillus sp.]
MSYRVIDPMTGAEYRSYPDATDAEVDQALATSAKYFEEQPTTRYERAQHLLKFAQIFDDEADKFAEEAAHNMGKLFKEGQGESHAAANITRYYANHGEAFLTPKPYVYGPNDAHAQLEYAPTGIIMSVEPWNFPYTQVIRVLAPNYLAGNPVILKHASSVAGCAALIQDAARKAGMPVGAFQNLCLTHDQVARVIADPRVQGLAVTGSEPVGRQLAGLAGQNLTKSTLELGGSDACLILDDADMDNAIKEAAISRLRNSGQTCTSAKRFIVRREVADEFVAGLKRIFTAQVVGDPMDPKTTLAPLASKRGQEKLAQQVDNAVQHGATAIVAGGPTGEATGFMPTLLGDITPDNPASQEEFFGPVAQLYVVDSDDEAVKIANATPFGLAGAVFSADEDRAHRVASRMATGQVFINKGSTGIPELPFGGVKNSGYGREMSDLGIMEFMNAKIVVYPK